MAIRVGRMNLSFFVSSWMMIHLGRNPVSGGRPPLKEMTWMRSQGGNIKAKLGAL